MNALAICPTYGRLPYLGRMLSSFIHQTYEDKHLIILNDDPNVELICNIKDVTVLNCSRKIRLSEKRNIGSCFGFYDILFPWDDDDIYLPSRISNHIEKYSDPEVRAYRNLSSYTVYGDKFFSSHGSINSKSYRKDEWFRIGGYQEKSQIGEDLELYNRLEGFLIEEDDTKRDFVYNYGGVNYHLSGGSSNLEEIAYNQLKKLNIIGGKFHIQPDFEQYNNFLHLDRIWKEREEELTIKHTGDAQIDISHLL